jgi:hypothetical protein
LNSQLSSALPSVFSEHAYRNHIYFIMSLPKVGPVLARSPACPVLSSVDPAHAAMLIPRISCPALSCLRLRLRLRLRLPSLRIDALHYAHAHTASPGHLGAPEYVHACTLPPPGPGPRSSWLTSTLLTSLCALLISSCRQECHHGTKRSKDERGRHRQEDGW